MFDVLAGKYEEHHELNVKYSNSFDTLDDAIKAYDEVSNYPWAYIQYKGRTLELWGNDNSPFN